MDMIEDPVQQNEGRAHVFDGFEEEPPAMRGSGPHSYFEPESMLHEASPNLLGHSRSSAARRRPMDNSTGTPSFSTNRSERMRLSRLGDDDDEEEEDGIGFLLARPRSKLKSPSPFTRTMRPNNTPNEKLSYGLMMQNSKTTPGGSLLDNSGYAMSSLGKIAPSILEEASGFIRQRLAEHTLTAFTEKAALDKAKAFLSRWKYSAELSRLWSHQDRNLQMRHDFKITSRSFKSWVDVTCSRKTQTRMVLFALHKVNWSCIKSVFRAWISMRTQGELICRLERRTEWRTMRAFLNAWTWTAASLSLRDQRINTLQQKSLQKLGHTCMGGWRECVSARKGFLSIQALVLRLNRLQLHTCFHGWVECVEYRVIVERAALTSEWRWGLVVAREAIDRWSRTSGFQRLCHHRRAVMRTKLDTKLVNSAFIGWTEITTEVKNKLHILGFQEERRRRKLKVLALTFLRFEVARIERLRRFMERFCEKYILSFVTNMFDAWIAFVREIRMRQRSNRKVARHYFDTHRKVLHEWNSVTRRTKRWRHVVAIFRKKIDAPVLVKHFVLWQEESAEYWMLWRKSEKLRARLSRWLVAAHFVQWFERHRARANFVVLTLKSNAHLTRTVLYEWADQVSAMVAWEAWTGQAVEVVRNQAGMRHKVAAFDLWYLKIRRRIRVEELISAKEAAEAPRLLELHAGKWAAWTVHCRALRMKAAGNASRLDRKAMKRALDAFAETTYVVKTLLQRGMVTKRASGGRVISRVFQTWSGGCLQRLAQDKALALQCARTDRNSAARVLLAWVEVWGELQQRARRARKVEDHVVPRWTCTWALRLWVDKHNRTMQFDREVARQSAATLRAALAGWEEGAQLQKAQITALELIDARVGQRRLRVKCAEWRAAARACLRRRCVLSQAELRAAARMQWRSFEGWRGLAEHHEGVRGRLQRSRARGAARRKRAAVREWRECVERAKEGRRAAGEAAWAEAKVCGRRVVAGWASVAKAAWTREMKLRGLRGEVRRRGAGDALEGWRKVAAGRQRRVRRGAVLQSRVERRWCWSALSGWAGEAAAAAETLRAVEAGRAQRGRRALREVMGRWVGQHVMFERRGARVVEERSKWVKVKLQREALGGWRGLCRFERRLGVRIGGWERRDTEKAMGAWEGRVRYALSLRVRARKCLLRGEGRRRVRAFGAWAMAACVHVERRLELLRMHRRREARLAARSWQALEEAVGQARRAQVLERRAAAAVVVVKTRCAAQALREHWLRARRRRRATERIALAHRSRVLRSAVLWWAGEVASRKRTQHVLTQAMTLLE